MLTDCTRAANEKLVKELVQILTDGMFIPGRPVKKFIKESIWPRFAAACEATWVEPASHLVDYYEGDS